MRKLILPLVIILLGSSFYGYSQGTCVAASAQVLTVGCNNYTLGAAGTGAQSSPIAPVCTPAASYPADRVTWFKFTPATNIMSASIGINLNTAAPMQVAFYDPGTGTCPTNITSTAAGSGLQTASTFCSATGGGTLMPPGNLQLLAGRTYFVRIYAHTTATDGVNICYTPVTIQTIPVLATETCNNYTMGDLGTGSNFSPLPTGVTNRCGYANDRRVTWFKFTPSSTLTCATFNINVDNGPNTEVAFYNQAGAYQSASTLCMPNGGGIWAPALPVTLTMGQTYYLRIYTANNDANPHSINICAKPFVQPNDLCNTATRIDDGGIQSDNVCATGSGATSPPYEPSWVTSNSNTLLCAPVLQNTAWYYFIVEDNTINTIVNVSGINCSNYGGGDLTGGVAGIQMGVLQGVPAIPNCTTTNGLIVPPNASGNHCYQTTATSFNFTVTPGPTVKNGTKMYIAVDGFNGANCSYVLSTINAIPIPVKLKYFTVWKQAQSNELKWITSWETNNKNFEIERSLDGTNFVVIGSVPGTGTSSTDVQYKFEDNEAPLLAYYRLKQIDIDGKYEYSNVISIKRDNIKSLFGLTFENPAHNSSVITINTEKAGTTLLRVIDVAGRELSIQVVDCGRGNNTVVKDFSRLTAGNYYLIATQGDNRIVKPFIKL